MRSSARTQHTCMEISDTSQKFPVVKRSVCKVRHELDGLLIVVVVLVWLPPFATRPKKRVFCPLISTHVCLMSYRVYYTYICSIRPQGYRSSHIRAVLLLSTNIRAHARFPEDLSLWSSPRKCAYPPSPSCVLHQQYQRRHCCCCCLRPQQQQTRVVCSSAVHMLPHPLGKQVALFG